MTHLAEVVKADFVAALLGLSLHLSLEFLVETAFCLARLVFTILFLVHCKLEQLFVVLTAIPAFFLHLFDEMRQCIRVVVLRVACEELEAFLLGEFHDLRCQSAREFSGFAENHVPCGRVDRCLVTRLALAHREEVHQGDVLGVLAERRH